MQNKQYDLCLRVLQRMDKAGVLQHLVLVGSWCLVLYRKYFKGIGTVHAVRTRDMDFLVPLPFKLREKVDLPGLLQDLGFLVSLRGQQGVVQLVHPEVLIEFLVPERGRGSDAVMDLPRLGVNAQPLRFMDIPLMMTEKLSFGPVPVLAPHPAAFALHKLLIVPRRRNAEKKNRDLDAGVLVLTLLDKKGEMRAAKNLLARFPRTWARSILTVLRGSGQGALANRLEN